MMRWVLNLFILAQIVAVPAHVAFEHCHGHDVGHRLPASDTLAGAPPAHDHSSRHEHEHEHHGGDRSSFVGTDHELPAVPPESNPIAPLFARDPAPIEPESDCASGTDASTDGDPPRTPPPGSSRSRAPPVLA